VNNVVPQKRIRVFLIGVRDEVPFEFPSQTHAHLKDDKPYNGLKPYCTAGEVISDLDDGTIKPSERIGGKWGHLLLLIPPGMNYLHLTKEAGHPNPIFNHRSRYWTFLLKLSPNLPSWTIQASASKYKVHFTGEIVD